MSTPNRIIRRLYPPLPQPPSAPGDGREDRDSFQNLLVEAGAEVVTCTANSLSATVIGLIGRRGWGRVVSVRRNRVGHPSVLGDDPHLSDAELDTMEAVITESATAIADSGVIVLDHHSGQGRQGLTHRPGVHVCVVEEDDLVGGIAEAIDTVDWSGPTTLIGPGSRLPDLGFDPTEEWPGPSSLVVVLVEGTGD